MSPLSRLAQQIVWGLALIAAWFVGKSQIALAQENPLKPIYWQEKLFYIPYQANRQEKIFQRIDKVELLISRDGVSDWQVLQAAQPNVQGFSYHAATDGEYSFALRHLDRQGRVAKITSSQAQLRIIVDTQQPELNIKAVVGMGDKIVIHYEARDANLNAESLLLEVRTGKTAWTPLPIGTPDVRQPDKIVGRTNWQAPSQTGSVELRASVTDRSGHRATATTELILHGPNLKMPTAPDEAREPPSSELASKDPFLAQNPPPAQPWPAHNELAEKQGLGKESLFVAPPPLQNPYTSVGHQHRAQQTPAQHLAGVNSRPGSLDVTPLDSENTPLESGPSGPSQDGWSSPRQPHKSDLRMVNSRTFDVEYDIESVGPWGVAKVELWGTHDGGNTWQSYGTDPDNRSPLRVTVPGSGVYGFRILVQAADGAAIPAPRAGEPPELMLAVDLLPPQVEITQAVIGKDDSADHLSVAWRAKDSHLEQRPISLSYSSHPGGPWTTIAAGLENSGSYAWRIERHVPARFYLRIEALDVAGNMATHQTPAPIVLPRPQPKGTLLDVRPVDSNLNDRRAAQGLQQR